MKTAYPLAYAALGYKYREQGRNRYRRFRPLVHASPRMPVTALIGDFALLAYAAKK